MIHQELLDYRVFLQFLSPDLKTWVGDHQERYAHLSKTADALKPSVADLNYLTYLSQVYRYKGFNIFLFTDDLYTSDDDSAKAHHWVTKEPTKIYPQKRVLHVTSNLAIESMAQGQLLKAPKLLTKEKVMTHKGHLLDIVDRFIQATLKISTGEKRSFLWTAPEADPEDYHLISKAGHLSSHTRIAQQQRFYELIEEALAVQETDALGCSNAAKAIADHLHVIMGIREGFYSAVIRRITEMLQTDFGRHSLEHTLRMGKFFPPELDDIDHFFPVVIEIDLPEAYKKTAVNGINLIPIRRSGGSSRIAGLPLIDPASIVNIYSSEPLSKQVSSQFRVSDLSSFSRDSWLTGRTPEEIEAVDPLNSLCDTRYSERIPVLDHIDAGVVCPLLEQYLYPSIRADAKELPLLTYLDLIPDIGGKDVDRHIALSILDQTTTPGLFDPLAIY